MIFISQSHSSITKKSRSYGRTMVYYDWPVLSAKHLIRPSELERTARVPRGDVFSGGRTAVCVAFLTSLRRFRVVWAPGDGQGFQHGRIAALSAWHLNATRRVFVRDCWPFSFTYQPIVSSRAHACVSLRAFKHT